MVDGAHEAAEGLSAIPVEMGVGGPGDRLGEPRPSLERLQPGLRPVAEPGLHPVPAGMPSKKKPTGTPSTRATTSRSVALRRLAPLRYLPSWESETSRGPDSASRLRPARRRRSSIRVPICTSR